MVDAASLSRGLYLTSELHELGVPTVVAVNMIDVAANEGVEIDRCMECRGTWLDAGELELITEFAGAEPGLADETAEKQCDP